MLWSSQLVTDTSNTRERRSDCAYITVLAEFYDHALNTWRNRPSLDEHEHNPEGELLQRARGLGLMLVGRYPNAVIQASGRCLFQ
jgi:hypothetical protein